MKFAETTLLKTLGIGSIVLAVVTLAVCIGEIFLGLGGGLKIVNIPGFQELDLEKTGVYVGMYQHQGSGPIPIEALSKLDVRLVNKETAENIPILMNGAGQIFSRFGTQGMLLFNFMIDKPGPYSLSTLYPISVSGPSVPILLIPQTAQEVRPTLIVGGLFFLIFLGLGIALLIRARRLVNPLRKQPA